MAERYLLDTDIIVEYLRGSNKAVDYLEGVEGELLLSAISVAELWAGAKGEYEEKALDQFLLAFRIIAIDEGLAREGGVMRRQYGPSHGTGLADALVAAASMREEASLITFNTKHYPMAKDLQVPYKR